VRSLAWQGKQLAAGSAAAAEPLQLAPAADRDAAADETAVDMEVAADVDIAVVLETQLRGDSSY